MRENIEDILDFCLEDLKKGISQEECLAKYKEYAEELKPLLKIIFGLESLPKVEPSTTALYEALVKVGRYLPQSKSKITWPRWNLNLVFNPRYAFARAIAIILLFSFISWSTLTVSANSIPGEMLYPIKLFTEKIRFILTLNPEDKAELRLTFADKRTKELISRLKKDGVLDKELLKIMLEEAKLALDNIEYIPQERKPVFYDKVRHFNLFQKEILERIRPEIQEKDAQYVDRAIEHCGRRAEWMQEMEEKKMYCPWDSQHNCHWK